MRGVLLELNYQETIVNTMAINTMVINTIPLAQTIVLSQSSAITILAAINLVPLDG
jgi:hypothetical protein